MKRQHWKTRAADMLRFMATCDFPNLSDGAHDEMLKLCGTCARDKAMREGVNFDDCDDNEKCEIIGASFRGEAVEWRETDNGLLCAAYVEAGKPIPPPQDNFTMELPL